MLASPVTPNSVAPRPGHHRYQPFGSRRVGGRGRFQIAGTKRDPQTTALLVAISAYKTVTRILGNAEQSMCLQVEPQWPSRLICAPPIESEADDICAWRQPRSTPLAGSQVRFPRVSGSEALFPMFHRRGSFPRSRPLATSHRVLSNVPCVVVDVQLQDLAALNETSAASLLLFQLGW